jgi:uncharacterized protein
LKAQYIDGQTFRKMILSGATYLEKNKAIVDGLNVFPVPDGDTGTNMSLTMGSATKQINGVSSDLVHVVADAVAKGSLMGARGNSGVILSQLFRGISKHCKDFTTLDSREFAKALKEGSDTAYKAVMKPTEGTILTVARECAQAALRLSKDIEEIDVLLEKVIEHGNLILDKTPDMLPVLKEAGVVDAGGKGLIFIFQGALNALKNKENDIAREEIVSSALVSQVSDHHIGDENIEFGYCTEFIINTVNADLDKIKLELISDGDCLLVVGDSELVKVHVHTNNPGIVLEKAINYGFLSNIKIDNMRLQHENILLTAETDNYEVNSDVLEKKSKYGIISVTMGKGLTDIFTDLGVDSIIEGGQTMNPSTEDILNAMDKINSDTIIVMPNNSNIILAANQAKELSNREVIVIPSKTVPQGIAALLNFDVELSVEENNKNMLNAISKVKTAQVTYAVRTTSFNGKEISEGDIIGIGDGSIQEVGKDIFEVTLDLVDKMVTDQDEIVTIFYGEEISIKQAEELRDEITKRKTNVDVEVHYGGQPLYYYIISIE